MTRELPRVTMPEASQYIHHPNIENSIREKHHLYRRLFKELCRISGEQLTDVEMNEIYKYNLTHVYNNLDEFDIANLSLTLSTTSCEGLIKMLKKLKSIGAINNNVISFEYFINDMINDMLTKC